MLHSDFYFYMTSWHLKLRKEFSNDVDSARAALHSLTAADSPYGIADLTQLFRIAAHEGKKSRAQGRHLRVVSQLLLWCYLSIFFVEYVFGFLVI